MDDCVGLDLDQGGVVDQARDLDHGQGGSDLIEELAVYLADLLPFLDISHEDPRADHVGRLPAQRLDRGDDDLQGTASSAP